MLCLRYSLPVVTKRLEPIKISRSTRSIVIKGLSNVKEEIYSGLDS
ncbi:hypothetical protein OWV82_018809, partial [Melia azedarach]